jgi:hypothetical protein
MRERDATGTAQSYRTRALSVNRQTGRATVLNGDRNGMATESAERSSILSSTIIMQKEGALLPRLLRESIQTNHALAGTTGRTELQEGRNYGNPD